jgi:copper chaperone CopZ
MDPARPSDPDPADPFFPERADHAILETIEIATEGEDCDECVRKLRPVLKKITGVKDVKADLKHERVIVTFDARKTQSARSSRRNSGKRLQTWAGGRLKEQKNVERPTPNAERRMQPLSSMLSVGSWALDVSSYLRSRLLLRQAVKRAESPD